MDCFGLRPTDSADFAEIDGYLVDKQIVESLNKLKERFASSGFALRIESAYRPFERQLSIWNRKARGELKLLNAEGLPRSDQFGQFLMEGAEQAVTFSGSQFYFVAFGASVSIDHI